MKLDPAHTAPVAIDMHASVEAVGGWTPPTQEENAA